MVNKDSYGYNTLTANRIGEIHQATRSDEWYWIQGKLKIADWITRGKSPHELNADSIWQKGPAFMQLPEEEWPIHTATNIERVPEQKKVNFSGAVSTTLVETLASRIDVNRFSKFYILINNTAPILKLYRKFKVIHNSTSMEITPNDVEKAKIFWIKDAQQVMHNDVQEGKYKKLCPKNINGIIMVGGRAERLLEGT